MSAADFLLDTFGLKRTIKLLAQTGNEWIEDKAPQLGASIAFYTVFSLAPLILLVMSVFSLTLHKNTVAQDKIKSQVAQFAGSSSADVVGNIVQNNASQPKKGILATVVGVVIALFGASGVFGALQDSLNTIWAVRAKPGQGIMGYIRARFISFAMVGGVCFLLLVSLAVSSLIEGFSNKINHALPGGTVLTTIINLVLNLLIITLLFAMIFKYLPDVKIAWRDVWIGAALTTVFFIVGKWGLGIYLGSGGASSAYGAAGAMISTLIWVYYTSQIVLFGAEFTQVYASEFGSHIQPEDHAVRIEKKVVELPNPNGAPAK